MTTSKDLPSSGYSIVKIYSTAAELRSVRRSDELPERPSLSVGWDWHLARSEESFEVRLTVGVHAHRERPYTATVDVVGRFKKSGDTASVSLDTFARVHAVAILLPYAREFLTQLTSRTLSGAYYLPALNV